MAIWQFDLELLPTVAIESDPQIVEHSVTDKGIETAIWWANALLPEGVEDHLNSLLPKETSWSANLDQWGAEDGNRIDVFREEGYVESIQVRIDVREPSVSFLEGACKLAELLECKLLVLETSTVLEPNLFSLRRAIDTSRAARYVSDPRGFLAELTDIEKT